MPFVIKDRVKETTTTTGTGTVTLAGAASGFQSFSAIGNANNTYYTIVGGTQWESGIGTYTSSGTTLSRDTVLASSNSGALVNFSAGTKDVFVTLPATAYTSIGGRYFSQGTPTTKTTSTTLTGAETLAGILISDGPFSALTHTLPTGTNLQAALPANVAAFNDIAFYLYCRNTGGSSATLAVNTGIVASGPLGINNNGSTAFLIRKTSTNNFTIYRIAG